jgi:hypothetical protein
LVEDESVLQRLYCGETYLCGFQKEKEICSIFKGKIAVGKLDFKKLRIVSLWELGGSFM